MTTQRAAAAPQGQARADRAFDHVTHLAGRIGSRLAGTNAEQDGIAYLAAHFAAVGLEPRVEVLPVPIWEEQRSALTVSGSTVSAVSPCFSGVTGYGGVHAPLVAVGDPMSEGDLANLDLSGKVALINGRDVQVDYPDYIQTDLLVANDVAGVVFVAGPGQQGGLPQAYYNFKRALHQSTPPSLIVSYQDAVALAANPSPVTLTVEATATWSTSANVWAELPGSDLAHDIILVSAHHDSVRGSPGASDNAGGCGIVAELARVFASGPHQRRTIRFVHFGAHEVGLFGSETWLRNHVQDIERIVAVINFDGHGLVDGQDTASLLGGTDWVKLAGRVLEETRLPLDVRYEAAGGVGVDSVNFAALGRNAINFGNGGAPRAHTAADHLGPLGPTGMEGALRMGEALLAETADRDDIDLTSRPPEEQVRETQVYCARWGWGISA